LGRTPAQGDPGAQVRPGTHFQAGFDHLFGYDAAYYGYPWSLALGDDMYTAFAKAGPTDPATGARYRRTVLERGGSVDGTAMVREFLGRAPDNAAFLRHLGLTDDTPDPPRDGSDLLDQQHDAQLPHA
jgi:thimet oligopeptidase